MKQFTTTDGNITFTVPDSSSDVVEIGKEASLRTSRQRRRSDATTAEERSEINEILDAFIEDEPDGEKAAEQRAHSFSVDVGEGPSVKRRRGTKPPESESLNVDVPLKPDEQAVILIEQDGFYEWHFPEKVAEKKRRLRRGGPELVRAKTAHFSIPIGEGVLPKRTRNEKRVFRGAVTNYIKGKVTGVVLKFVTRKTVGALSKRLEKGVTEGPVIITSATDAESWRHESDYNGVKLPEDRPARVLLLIHGTFSSTEGSFGPLTEHEEGQLFLTSALSEYDAVIGYDHYTLAENPEQNAENIYDRLDDLQKRSQGGLVIDALSFSRGGLVYRYLTEQIVPKQGSGMSFHKAIFVGCTNAGTELANNENWKILVDFYTTMIAGASRLLALHPASRMAGVILSQGIRIIGSLVKYMAKDIVADNAVPGLASMCPKGSFVNAINEVTAGRIRPGARHYYAIGSDFEPGPDTSAGKLGKRMALKVADGVVDRMMGEKNDLVVNRSSMFFVDPVPSAVLMEKMQFDQNGEIYHTVYFHQPQVSRQCADWLGLSPAKNVLRREAPRSWWASEVSRDFTTLPARMSVDSAAHALENNDTRFVVIERTHDGDELHYGLSRADLIDALSHTARRDASVAEALDMHESASLGVNLDDVLESDDIGIFRSKTASIPSSLPGGVTRAVIVDESGPVGVAAPPGIVTATERAMSAPAARASRTFRRSSPAETQAEKTTVKKKSVRRSMRSAKPSLTQPPQEALAPVTPLEVWCYASATMPEEAVLNKKSTVDVTLSRDEILLIQSEASKKGGGKVQVDKALIVQVQARKNCVVSGESRVEVPVPEPGEDALYFFDVIPKFEGVGEVRVIVRQGNRAIANLKLFPRFVAASGKEIVGMTRAAADLVPTDSRKETKNVLYIREVQMGRERALDFDFEFEVDGKKMIVRKRSKSFKDDDARLAYITDLYRKLENFWADSDSEYKAFMYSLRSSGAKIFKELIPKELQQVLWDNRDKLHAIQVFSDEPFIPWELAYLVEPGKPISPDSYFLAEKGMVRGYSDPDGVTILAPEKLRFRKGMARFVIPSYPEGSRCELPGAQKEKKMLEQSLDATPIKPDKVSVLDALQEPGAFDILHFACHGVADSGSIWADGLLMEGRMDGSSYKPEKLSSEDVDGYANLHDETSPGPVVMLNACQVGRSGYSLTKVGGFASTFMHKGAGAFIGTHWSVGDHPALVFSRTLYEKLLAGDNMMTAITAAREAAKNDEEVTWLAYVVYADPYATLEMEQ